MKEQYYDDCFLKNAYVFLTTWIAEINKDTKEVALANSFI